MYRETSSKTQVVRKDTIKLTTCRKHQN